MGDVVAIGTGEVLSAGDRRLDEDVGGVQVLMVYAGALLATIATEPEIMANPQVAAEISGALARVEAALGVYVTNQ